jgi:hypothetical protein
MRPLKITPGHAITGLALAPDGQKLGVVQWNHGFRLFDAITGAELGRDTTHASVYEVSPTGRYSLHADRAEIRLAEVTAGRPFLKFQTGWARAGGVSRPPTAPETSPLSRGCSLSSTNYTARSPHRLSVSDAGLTADHRFAVGRQDNYSQLVVCDLAYETTVAANLDLSASRSGYEAVRTVFTPDETRIVALTARALFVYDLPSPKPLAPEPLAAVGTLVPRASVAPVLSPVVTFRVTQPQPDPLVPPFALLPCGGKVLLRGEKSRVELRDLATGEVLTIWKWGLPRVNALAVTGDGLTAAAGGASGHVVMWDLG